MGIAAYSGASIKSNDCMKINPKDMIPKPANIFGMYFDLKNK